MPRSVLRHLLHAGEWLSFKGVSLLIILGFVGYAEYVCWAPGGAHYALWVAARTSIVVLMTLGALLGLAGGRSRRGGSR